MNDHSKLYDYSEQQNIDTEKPENFINHDIEWLKNSYEDDIWELEPHIITDDKSKYTITWDLYDLENYNVSFTDGIIGRWLQRNLHIG